MVNWALILILALIIEVITIFGRFFLRLSSKEIYIKLVKMLNLRFFVHFHHSFSGVIIAFISYYLGFQFLFDLGLAMVLADLIHHFIVLWIIVGNPEFHLMYKNPEHFKKERYYENKRIESFIKHLFHVFD